MPHYKITSKWGPYPMEKLVKMKNGYENYISRHKAQITCSQYRRLENIVKAIGIAIGRPGEELNPDYISKKLNVSRVTARSYLGLIYIETNR